MIDGKGKTIKARILLFKSLPNDKILDQSKLKTFADNKLKVIKMAKFVLDKIENVVGKEENAGNQHFLLFHNVSKGLFLQGR